MSSGDRPAPQDCFHKYIRMPRAFAGSSDFLLQEFWKLNFFSLSGVPVPLRTRVTLHFWILDYLDSSDVRKFLIFFEISDFPGSPEPLRTRVSSEVPEISDL